MRDVHYKGITICRCNRNSSGMRWWALTDYGIIRADTLQGIKYLIRGLSDTL